MPHEARQVPSWLIFDVGQKMNPPASTPEVNSNVSAAASQVCAWLGLPIYAGLFFLAAVSAAGAPGPNHGAQFWNSILMLWPLAGAVVSIVAIAKSKRWIGRLTAAIPLLGYLAVISNLIAWKLAH